jgi:hypothetical protein
MPPAWQVYMANLAMDATDDQIRDFCEKMGQVSNGQCGLLIIIV